jgi:hypothetical protein
MSQRRRRRHRWWWKVGRWSRETYRWCGGRWRSCLWLLFWIILESKLKKKLLCISVPVGPKFAFCFLHLTTWDLYNKYVPPVSNISSPLLHVHLY